MSCSLSNGTSGVELARLRQWEEPLNEVMDGFKLVVRPRKTPEKPVDSARLVRARAAARTGRYERDQRVEDLLQILVQLDFVGGDRPCDDQWL